MDQIIEELPVADGSGDWFSLGGVSFFQRRPPRYFPFHLYRKQAAMGEVAVDQLWMDTGTLYGQRQRPASNQESIINCWWAMCMEHATVFEDDVQESYILAKLLPFARSNGSRRVFVDSIPERRGNRRAVGQSIATLETRLAASCDDEMDTVEFRDQTAELLGPPLYPEEVQIRYREREAELLGEGREALEREGESGLNVAIERWQGRMNGIGRHRGHELEKQILGIFSYECRAALHRCYSAVWSELIPHLARKYALSEQSVRFHQLWHLEKSTPSNVSEITYFHLFHGHIFALHPACARFIQTRTGSALVGQWLTDPGSEAAFGRLLHGIYVACYQYADENNLRTELRKGEGRVSTVSDMAALEEQQREIRSGRRRRRR